VLSCCATNKVAAVGHKKSAWEAESKQKRLQLLLRQVSRDGADVMFSDALFQMHEAATGNALSLTVYSVCVVTC